MRNIICAKCGVHMICVKTGVNVIYRTDVVYSGDRFACRLCGGEVIVRASEALPLGTSNDEQLGHDILMQKGE